MPARPSVRRRAASAAIVLTLAGILAFAAVAAATPTYQLTLWGSLRTDGAGNAQAYAINDSGAVTGELAANDGGTHAYVRTPGGIVRDAGALLAGTSSWGQAINTSGLAAGSAWTQSNGFAVPFEIVAGTATLATMTRLPGGGDAVVYSLSDSGVAVGWGNFSSGCGSPPCPGNPGQAVKWTVGGTLVRLAALGGYFSAATGISHDGSKICGYAANPSGQTRGFLAAADAAIELAPLPGYDAAYAWSVNDQGVVVGHSEKAGTGEHRATLWNGGAPVDLGVLPGTLGSTAWHVANSGLVSGWLYTSPTTYDAATFTAAGPPVDLNTRLATGTSWTLRNAYASNAHGQVCGYADSGAVTHAFLLTPTSTADVAPAARATGLALACTSRNPGTGPAKLAFTLPAPGHVRLEILDVAGRRVARIADAAFGAGRHELAWDGRDDAGRTLGAGLYLARLVTDDGSATARLVRTR